MSAGHSPLAALRQAIEQLDEELIRLLARRRELAGEIGAVKRDARRPVLDPAQEAAVVRRAVALGREAGLPDDLVRELFWRIVAGAREAQSEGSRDRRPSANF